jgi:hypothetical protein
MNKKIHIAIVKYTAYGSVGFDEISKESRIPIDIIRRYIRSLAKDNFLTIAKGKIETSMDQRLRLATLAIKEGMDLEGVCKALGWREFEDIVAFMLERNGFKTMKHFRFKSPLRGYEVDVLGFRRPLTLSIDCKHWKRSWQRAATIRAIKAQVERTAALIQLLPSLKDNFKNEASKNARFLPFIVTLSEAPVRIYEKVPVVPIFQFQNFLDEMSSHMDELMILKDCNKTRE